MKKFLLILCLVSCLVLLCGCTNTATKDDSGSDNCISESTPTVSEEALSSDSEPAKADEIVSAQEENAEVSTNTTASESKKTRSLM